MQAIFQMLGLPEVTWPVIRKLVRGLAAWLSHKRLQAESCGYSSCCSITQALLDFNLMGTKHGLDSKDRH